MGALSEGTASVKVWGQAGGYRHVYGAGRKLMWKLIQ